MKNKLMFSMIILVMSFVFVSCSKKQGSDISVVYEGETTTQPGISIQVEPGDTENSSEDETSAQ